MPALGFTVHNRYRNSWKRYKKMGCDKRHRYRAWKTVKLAQYADDTTVILEDSESILHLFELLSQFEKCSGLRINESKSELLWLGSDRFCKDKIRNLKLNEKPILALGVYVSYDDKLAAQKNVFDKLASL